MSDSDDSAVDTPNTHAGRLSQRRRGYGRVSSTPRDSSPDELALQEPPKSSRLNSVINTPAGESSPVRNSYRAESPYYRSASPDELGRAYPYENDGASRPYSIPHSSRASSEVYNEDLADAPAYVHDEAPTPPASHEPSEYFCYEPLLAFKAHDAGIAQVKFSPDGRWIASCSADATIKIWDSTSGELINTLSGHMAGISTISWSPDSTTLASGSDDKSIRLWDRSSGLPFQTIFNGHHNYVVSVAFSPKGNMLVSGSFDEAVHLWDTRSGKIMRRLPAHSDPVYDVTFIHDGTLIASCSTDGLIRIWDTASGQCLRTLVHEDNVPVVAVRFVKNGRYVLAWTLDSCVRLWDYVAGRPMKTYQGHVNEKYSISGAFGTYTMDGELEPFVVSGSEDGSLLFWNMENKDPLQKVDGAHQSSIIGVDVHPTTEMIVSCSADGFIRFWRNKAARVQLNGHLSNGTNGNSEVQVKYEQLEESLEGMGLDGANSPNGALGVDVDDDTPAYA